METLCLSTGFSYETIPFSDKGDNRSRNTHENTYKKTTNIPS